MSGVKYRPMRLPRHAWERRRLDERGESSRYKAARQRFIKNSLLFGHFPVPRVGTGGSPSDHRGDSVGTGQLRLGAGVLIHARKNTRLIRQRQSMRREHVRLGRQRCGDDPWVKATVLSRSAQTELLGDTTTQVHSR